MAVEGREGEAFDLEEGRCIDESREDTVGAEGEMQGYRVMGAATYCCNSLSS